MSDKKLERLQGISINKDGSKKEFKGSLKEVGTLFQGVNPPSESDTGDSNTSSGNESSTTSSSDKK